MNSNLEENEIRKLFHELRRADFEIVPAFETHWNPRSTSGLRPKLSPALELIAAGLASLVLLSAGLWFVHHDFPLTLTAGPSVVALSEDNVHVPANVMPPTYVERYVTPTPSNSVQMAAYRHKVARRPLRVDRRRLAIDTQLAKYPVLQWRPPTEFLLRTPADELLKNLPALKTQTDWVSIP